MDRLRFGTAGIPYDTPNRNTINGIKYVRKLGLESMELEFVRSVNISEDAAPEIKKTAKANDVVLTCHAPYFINLNAIEKPKIYASMHRILNSAKIANLCGGYSVTFHAGFYLKMDPKKVFENIRKRIKEISKKLIDEGNNIWIRPEVTGKFSQFGTIEEILKLSQEIENVMPCVDFAHQHAKTGKYNTYEEFSEILESIEKSLGKEGLNNMHIHVSGIEYTEKGERRHLILDDSDMNYKDLMKAFKDYKIKGVVTCESPVIDEDSLLMQRTYNKIYK
ncbi:TIM barrel protein [Candidatus Woesearchaeota archaeon]|nr:TIM barrel protein [Candidatus Woesearchaeota archaeon]